VCDGERRASVIQHPLVTARQERHDHRIEGLAFRGEEIFEPGRTVAVRHPVEHPMLVEVVQPCRDDVASGARVLVELVEAVGMQVIGQFRDLDRPDRFVWLRGFSDMASRHAALEAFYGGPVWRAHANEANATMIESDDVLMLHPVVPTTEFGALPPRPRPGEQSRAAVLAATICSVDGPAVVAELERGFLRELAAMTPPALATFVEEQARTPSRLCRCTPARTWSCGSSGWLLTPGWRTRPSAPWPTSLRPRCRTSWARRCSSGWSPRLAPGSVDAQPDRGSMRPLERRRSACEGRGQWRDEPGLSFDVIAPKLQVPVRTVGG
jgi:hypothetical protein